MCKKIMILGASALQTPAIISAKEKGLHVIVVDKDANAAGVKYADEFFEISTIDEVSIISIAEKINIDGIMTLATDMPMRAVAAVGNKLGLNTIDYETAIRATDKTKMREALLKHNVSIPAFFIIDNFDDFTDLIQTCEFELIMKPADSSGSRGVCLLRDRENLLEKFEYTKKFSRSGKIIVEEYMSGNEVSVESITIEGTTKIIAITDKITTGAPHFVEMGHSIQSQVDGITKLRIEELVRKTILAIGIENGPSHTEIMLTDEGPKVVEIGARLGGDNITTKLVPLATGVDMVGACIDLALGEIPDLSQKVDKGAAIRYIDSKVGIISDIHGVVSIDTSDSIVEVVITKKIGDEIGLIESSSDRVGYIIAQSDDAGNAVNICNEALKKIKINME